MPVMKVNGSERTKGQTYDQPANVLIYTSGGPNELTPPGRVRVVSNGVVTYLPGYLSSNQVKEMRADPTVKLARTLVVAPALEAGWSVESDAGVPAEIHTAIEKIFVPQHTHIMRSGMLGNIDYGWTPYEKVWEYDENYKLVVLRKLKQLLQANTVILVDKNTGAYVGLLNNPGEVRLEVEETLLLYQNVEGTNWYGESDLLAVYPIVEQYNSVSLAADRYDTKMAGAHWVLKYPQGRSTYNGRPEVDNADIARDILASIQASGRVIMPSQVSQMVNNLSDLSSEPKAGWELELIEAGGSANTTMIDRMRYLDTLKVRAFGAPERSILEGQHGTLAEASEHGDFALININIRRLDITRECNWHLINHFIRINWGSEYENKIRLVPNPINDVAIKFVRDIYTQMLTGSQAQDTMQGDIDVRALAERVSVPLLPAAQKERITRTVEDSLRTAES
jgi:hypothetical protein